MENEEIKPEQQTAPRPEPAKDAKDQQAAKIAELQALVGKSFKFKNGKAAVKVLQYNGVGIKDGQSYHTLLVEGSGMRFTPAAKDFLENYEEITN